MVSLTPLEEEILYITDDATPDAATLRRRRVVRWLCATAGLVGLLAVAVIGFAVVVKQTRQRERAQCDRQLKRLGEAMHEYYEVNQHFPAPSLIGKDGKPLLSWRVALLPQLGYEALYKQFHLDEPWDSPHNRTLLARMPREYACPGGPGQSSGKSGYLVIVGPASDPWSVNTPFLPTRGVDLREILDGSSNTLLVLETVTFVEWTKPEDLHWAKDGPLPGIISPHEGGANALFADGSTKFLKTTIASVVLQGLLTINGAEVLGGG